MNALVRIFSPEPVEALDLSEFDALTDMDFSAPLETPTERDLREAEEAVKRYDTVITGCDNLLADTEAQKAEAIRLRAGRMAQIVAIKKSEPATAPAPRKAKRA